MILVKKLDCYWEYVVVVPDFLRQMLYGLILPALLIHILDGLIFKIVFLFWQVLKYEIFF